jgi:hypothetical protein
MVVLVGGVVAYERDIPAEVYGARIWSRSLNKQQQSTLLKSPDSEPETTLNLQKQTSS